MVAFNVDDRFLMKIAKHSQRGLFIPKNRARPKKDDLVLLDVKTGTRLSRFGEAFCSMAGEITVNFRFGQPDQDSITIAWDSFESGPSQVSAHASIISTPSGKVAFAMQMGFASWGECRLYLLPKARGYLKPNHSTKAWRGALVLFQSFKAQPVKAAFQDFKKD